MSDQFIPYDILEGIQDIADEIGKTIHIRRCTDTSNWVDATKPSLGKVRTCVSCAASVVMTDYTEDIIDGTIIQQGDRGMLVSLNSVSLVPISTDVVVMDREIWKIMDIRPVEVSGVLCSMNIRIRK